MIEHYIEYERQEPAKLGAIDWGGLISAGTSLIGGLFGGGSKPPNQAKGLQAIQQKANSILTALDSILASVTAGQGNTAQAVAQAQTLVAALSDPNEFYQAQRGDDAAALSSAKSSAQQKLQAIMSAAATVSGANTIPNQVGQVAAAGGTFTQRLLADNTLLYIGAGLAIVYLVTRK